MLLQRLATGATGVKQARYRRDGAARHSYTHAQYTQPVYYCVALAVQCETTHGVYEFRRGFCTSVLSFSPSVFHSASAVENDIYQVCKAHVYKCFCKQLLFVADFYFIGEYGGRITETNTAGKQRFDKLHLTIAIWC